MNQHRYRELLKLDIGVRGGGAAEGTLARVLPSALPG